MNELFVPFPHPASFIVNLLGPRVTMSSMICSLSPSDQNLQDTGFNNGRLLVVIDLTATAASGLKSLDDHQRLLISNLTEDDVLAIEPAGDNGGDEELRAVAVGTSCQLCFGMGVRACLRVWTGIGHGQKSWLGVLAGEVLVGELLTVDGLATSALCNHKPRSR
jgi:hypothetical protein